MQDEELRLLADPRLEEGIQLFNAGEWHGCHDLFEELWHETCGPMRPVLQGILQVAVAQLHLERGNSRGAMILFGEGLGRLQRCDDHALGITLEPLRRCIRSRLLALQSDQPLHDLPLPQLGPCQGSGAHNL